MNVSWKSIEIYRRNLVKRFYNMVNGKALNSQPRESDYKLIGQNKVVVRYTMF